MKVVVFGSTAISFIALAILAIAYMSLNDKVSSIENFLSYSDIVPQNDAEAIYLTADKWSMNEDGQVSIEFGKGYSTDDYTITETKVLLSTSGNILSTKNCRITSTLTKVSDKSVITAECGPQTKNSDYYLVLSIKGKVDESNQIKVLTKEFNTPSIDQISLNRPETTFSFNRAFTGKVGVEKETYYSISPYWYHISDLSANEGDDVYISDAIISSKPSATLKYDGKLLDYRLYKITTSTYAKDPEITSAYVATHKIYSLGESIYGTGYIMKLNVDNEEIYVIVEPVSEYDLYEIAVDASYFNASKSMVVSITNKGIDEILLDKLSIYANSVICSSYSVPVASLGVGNSVSIQISNDKCLDELGSSYDYVSVYAGKAYDLDYDL